MQNKRHAAAVLIGMQIFQVIVCILPGQPIQLAASYIFGIPAGYLISITGAVIGACCSFYLAKALGKDAVETIFGKDKVENYRRKINSGKGLTAVLLIYLIPGIPKDLAAYAAGISDMRVRPFLIVSTIGRSPAMLGSLMFGHLISSKNYPAIGILGAVTIIILVVCFIKRKTLIEMLDDLEKKDQEMYPE